MLVSPKLLKFLSQGDPFPVHLPVFLETSG